MTGEQVLGVALLALAAWRWVPLYRARPAVAVGQRTSTCGITLTALCGALLVAEPAGAALASFVAGATSWLPSGLLAVTPGLLTLAVAAAALEVGGRGIGLAPRWTRPKLVHGPLAALLPIVAVAAWPLIGPTIALRTPEAVAEEAAPEVVTAPAVTCSPGGRPGEVAGWSGVQIDRAAEIVAAGRERGAPEQAQVIAVATAMQEASLRVLANPVVPASLDLPHDGQGSDHDSVGLFQQRQTWGPTSVLMDPRGSANLFYDQLLALPGWESMPLTVAAQRVQRSAHPRLYADDEADARTVVAAVDLTCTPS